MLKTTLIIFTLLITLSCSKKETKNFYNSSPKEEVFQIVGVYPDNEMVEGEGVREVGAIDYECRDSKGNVVEREKCGPTENVNLSQLPKQEQKSKAGLGDVAIPGLSSPIQVLFAEGQTWDDLDEETKKTLTIGYVNSNGITCNSGLLFSYEGKCIVPKYEYKYVNVVNNLDACSGNETVLRDYSCHYNITGVDSEVSNCSSETLTREQLISSPSGTVDYTSPDGDILRITCQQGKTIADVGTSGATVEAISCIETKYLNESNVWKCTLDNFEPTGLIYPPNNLNIGDGILEVEAIGFNGCIRGSNNSQVNLNLCSLSEFSPKETQLSPSGTIFYPISGAEGGGVDIFLIAGETILSISESNLNNQISSQLNCSEGFIKSTDNLRCESVEAESRIVKIAAIDENSNPMEFILDKDGNVYALGYNSRNVTGLGAGQTLSSWTKIVTENAIDIFTYGQLFCYISKSNLVYCSGYLTSTIFPNVATGDAGFRLIDYGTPISYLVSDGLYSVVAIPLNGYRVGSRATNTQPLYNYFSSLNSCGSFSTVFTGGTCSGDIFESFNSGHKHASIAYGACHYSNNYIRCAGKADHFDSSVIVTQKSDQGFYVPNFKKFINSSYGRVICYLTNDDDLYCFGNSRYGSMGDGLVTNTVAPIRLMASNVKAASKTNRETCYLAKDNRIFCTGADQNGVEATTLFGRANTFQEVTTVAGPINNMVMGGNRMILETSNGIFSLRAGDSGFTEISLP